MQGGGGGQRGLCALGRERHPDETGIGRTRKGFDFPGYHCGPEGLTVTKAPAESVERAARLASKGPGEPAGSRRLGMYVRRWAQWVRAGLGARSAQLMARPTRWTPTGHRSLARLRLRLTTADPEVRTAGLELAAGYIRRRERAKRVL
jgi:hypothetical protein